MAYFGLFWLIFSVFPIIFIYLAVAIVIFGVSNIMYLIYIYTHTLTHFCVVADTVDKVTKWGELVTMESDEEDEEV